MVPADREPALQQSISMAWRDLRLRGGADVDAIVSPVPTHVGDNATTSWWQELRPRGGQGSAARVERRGHLELGDRGDAGYDVVERTCRMDEFGETVRPPGESRFSFRLRAFILLRLTLIVAASYLVLAQYEFVMVPSGQAGIIFLGLASNVLFWLLPRPVLTSPRFLASLVVADTLWVAILLVVSGRFNPEFFYLFFFVVLLAAIGENLVVILLGTIVVSIAYFLVVFVTMGRAEALASSTLIRIPFLLAAAGFYGYLVDRIRRERQKAAAELLMVENLRSQQRQLEEVNRRLTQEIRDRQRIEEELKRASDMKSVFVSTVSHEFKTPLTAIKNAVDLLAPRIEALGESERRFLTITRRNIDRLAFIIGDLLEISRIEAGRIRCDFEEITVESFIEPAVSSIESQANESGLTLEVQIDHDLPLVWADSKRLEQVMANLLSNAIKFTPTGGKIVVGAGRTAAGVEISVTDTGIGLSPEDSEKIFEPFYQAGDPLTDRSRGTGLGLAISWSIVAAHGCELKVSSELRRGSRFFFTLGMASERTREATHLEEAIRRFVTFPFFSFLLVEQRDEGNGRGAAAASPSEFLDAVCERIEAVLPRSNDHIIRQPASRRVVIVLLGTGLDGGRIVRRYLAEALGTDPAVPVTVCGPSVFPEDGHTGFQLIHAAMTACADEKEDSDGEDPRGR